MSVLGARLLAIHDTFAAAGIPHAFGGAIALAYCTEEPRGTRDIDVNVFVPSDDAARCFAALPGDVATTDADLAAVRRDDQVRLWWDDTPIDLFFDAHDFHRETSHRVREVPFEGTTIPIIDCLSLVVFKARFNRTRDWADIEAMVEVGAFDAREAVGWLELLDADDEVTRRLRDLAT